LVQRVCKAIPDRSETPDHQGRLDHLEVKDHRDPRVRRGLLVRLVQLEIPASQETKAKPGSKEPLELVELKVHLVSKVFRGTKVSRVNKVSLVALDHLASPDSLGTVAQLEQLDFQGLLESKAIRDQQDLRVPRVIMVSRVSKAPLEQLEQLVLLASLETKEFQDSRVPQDNLALQDQRVLLDQQEVLVRLVAQVRLGNRVIRVSPDFLVHQV